MTTIAYGMTDLGPSHDGAVDAGTIAIPADRGGCGKQHSAALDDDRRPFVACDLCAPVMISQMYGWSATPSGVPLTPDELGEAELSKREGETSYRLAMKAMGDAVGEIVQGTRPVVKQPSLIEQIKALSAEERAGLASLFAADQKAGAEERAPAPQPIPPPGPAAKPPARRGRPPKNPPAA